MRKAYYRIAHMIEEHFRVDARYFLSGGFWLLFAQASTIISSLIATIILTRYLSENDFGVYRYIIGLGVILSAFSLTGINQAIIQAAAKGYHDFLRYSTSITLRYGLITSVIGLAGAIYYFVNDNVTLAAGCALIAALQPVTQLFLNALAHLQGMGKFQTGARAQLLRALFISGATIATVLLTQNIIALLASYFITQAISSYIFYRFYRPKIHTTENIPSEVKTQYITYAKHTSLRNLIIGIAARLDAIIVFQYLGAPALALYSVATLIPDHIKGSFKNIQTLIIPKYSRHESLVVVKASLPKRSTQFLLLLILLSVGFVVVIPFFYTLFFPNYLEGIPLVQLLALSFPASIYLLPLSAMQAHQMERELYILNTVSSIIQIAVLFVLIMFFSLVGAIWARIIGQYLHAFFAFGLLYIRKS